MFKLTPKKNVEPTEREKNEGTKQTEREKRKEDTLRLLSQCDTFLQSFTKRKANDQLSNIKFARSVPFGIGNYLAKKLKGVSPQKADSLVISINSVFDGSPKNPNDIREFAKTFPLDVVESYSEKLTNPTEALEILKEEYFRSGPDARSAFYNALKAMEFPPELSDVSGFLSLDGNKALTTGQESLKFPTLYFYVLLLQNYDKERGPGVFGKPGLSDNFVIILQKFIEAAHRLTKSSGPAGSGKPSDPFKNFEIKLKSLETLDAPVVKF